MAVYQALRVPLTRRQGSTVVESRDSGGDDSPDLDMCWQESAARINAEGVLRGIRAISTWVGAADQLETHRRFWRFGYVIISASTTAPSRSNSACAVRDSMSASVSAPSRR
jgi:hypothetical protein